MKHNALSFVLLFFSFHISCMVEFQFPIGDMAVVMGNLDYKSNVQFIRSCKKMYDFYAQKNDVLFTHHYLHPTDYMNAMIHFSRKDDVEKVKLLMQREGEENKNNRTQALLWFANSGYRHTDKWSDFADIVEMYKQKYDAKDALCIQNLVGCKPLLELVLKQGYCNFNYDYDEKGNTWLHELISRGEFNAVKSLLLLGALVDPNIKNNREQTPAHLLMGTNWGIGQKIETLHCLIAHPQFDPNVQSSGAYTLLHDAVQVFGTNNKIKLLNCLLSDSRTNCNMRNIGGMTPLDEAINSGNVEAFKCLFAKPSRFDCNSKNTAYDHAWSNPEMRQLLAPHVSFVNRHKQRVTDFIYYEAPKFIKLGLSAAILIDLVFCKGERTFGTLHPITQALGY